MPNEYYFAEKLSDLIDEAVKTGVSTAEIVSSLEFFKLATFHDFIYKNGEKDGE